MASNVCPLQVTILASEWGSSEGGLSTLNRELAIQLAKFSCVKVTFFLPKCSEEDKKAGASHGISILEAKRQPGFTELELLCFPPENLRIDVVVGHGVKLGHQAQVIRESHKCKWVQIVHTDPEELGMFKCYENPISTGEEKHQVEVELCQIADFVVGVGPKLAEAFRKYLSFCKRHQDVLEFTPGVFDDFSSVQQVPEERKLCSVLVFCRGDAEDFKLKGLDIAARSIAALSDTFLVFVGAPHGKHEEIAKYFVGFGMPLNRLRVKGYVTSQEDLKRLFYEVDLVLMPSRTEGFGLTGLEALSAGLPILVSKNSGFGGALHSVRFGSVFVIDSEDPGVWTAAIKAIWSKDKKSRLDEIKTLQGFYGERYNWSKQCRGLIEKMVKLVDGTSSESEITAQVAGAGEQNRNKDFAGFSPRVPPKMKRAIIEENEQEPPAGFSPRVPPKMKRAIIEENEQEPPAGTSRTSDQAAAAGNSGKQGLSAILDSEDQHSLKEYGELLVKLLISTKNLGKGKKEAVEKILSLTVQNYFKFNDHSRDDHAQALKFFTDLLIDTYGVNLVSVGEGSVTIIVECPSLESLEHLWRDYLNGYLNKVAERYLITNEMRKELNLETVCLTTTIEEENYLNCKMALMCLPKTCSGDLVEEGSYLYDARETTAWD
ncbi:uncharacterized protein LOC114951286 [Acropora millepora]|uniref:uncharacterized protein LOC114951286 n=1 Tax=Acropora millepora TaxID=45264 RepID=UPI001CF40F2D|nr:uncharacterized protein LOC114951286 [Acropora millepora]